MEPLSKALLKVRTHEHDYINKPLEDRPVFHGAAPIGWCNDPNGFSLYKGEVHLFYQYHPYSTHWGPMHWGHLKSQDMVKWEMLPTALAPDTEVDCDGCFSGSALQVGDEHYLLYTGVKDSYDEAGNKSSIQTQCLAIGDGLNYKKVATNPVIDYRQLPEGASIYDFRDPKLWKDDDGYHTVVADRAADGTGQILMFQSEDAKVWSYEGTLATCNKRYGRMWECPDFFKLGDVDVLMMSPQDMVAEGLEFHAGNNAIVLAGNYDREKCYLEEKWAQSIDYGLDFYAPQTMETEDGRRIMIAWFQSWDNYLTPEIFKWSGMMTFPREIWWQEDRLWQLPIREIEAYYTDRVHYTGLEIHEEKIALEGVTGRVLDMNMSVEMSEATQFTVRLAENQSFVTTLTYDHKKGIVEIDRTHSGMIRDYTTIRRMHVKTTDNKLNMRILLDQYSVEIFVNEGAYAMSSLIYTPLDAEGISFEADGKCTVDVTKHSIEV